MLTLNKTPSLSCTAICLNMVANTQTTMKTTSTRLFFSFLFIFSLCILASLINEFRFDTLLNFGRCAFANTNPSQSNNSSSVTTFISDRNSNSSTDDIRILIGILTLPDQYQRRQFLRLVYGTQSPPMGAQVDVKFVFCNLTKEEQKLIVALEIMLYDDIIILNCTENMNNGKTYTFFSSLPEMLSSADKPYNYVMKGDDDIYIRLENLVESLRPLPRQDLYYGFVIPCESMEPFKGHYMAGMAYLVSWDIVEWIRVSEIPKNNLHGPEDKVFGEWLRDGRRGKNRYNAKWSMYNFPDPPNKCSHELWPDTVAVHKLKNQDKWVKTLKYFNVTQNLKPSKLYPNI